MTRTSGAYHKAQVDALAYVDKFDRYEAILAKSQLRALAGQEHGRTIPLADCLLCREIHRTSDVDPALPESFEPIIHINLPGAHSHPKCDVGFQVVSRRAFSLVFLDGAPCLVSSSQLCIRGRQDQI